MLVTPLQLARAYATLDLVSGGAITQTGALTAAGTTNLTATGFDMSVMGEIPFSVDGMPIDFAKTVTYRGMMFTGVPNLVWVMGYFRASWTLRVDMLGDFVCNLLNHMRASQARSVAPKLRPSDAGMSIQPWVDTEDLNAGYLLRGLDRMPKRGDKPEWQHSQDYLYESQVLPTIDLTDPVFSYGY